MTISNIGEVEFGVELPVFEPDTSLANVRKFVIAAGWNGPRFTDHEAARKEGLPGALVPGILSQGFLAGNDPPLGAGRADRKRGYRISRTGDRR